jgi:ABC-type oligopeptide transport system substrate-binding subunit
MSKSVTRISFARSRWRAGACVGLAWVLALGGGCFEGEGGEQFYGRVAVPRAQEFRWSDGGLPRVFDPARAAAAPDTDAVRALFEGLTDHDPQTLRPVAAVASRWDASEGGRVWTFHLRADARWSNGDRVTAHDFVRSWRRTLRLGESAPHAELLSNLIEKKAPPAGARPSDGEGARPRDGEAQPGAGGESRPNAAARPDAAARANVAARQNESQRRAGEEGERGESAAETDAEQFALGVEAVDDLTLRVRLQRPDENFAQLVAHPVFRPVHVSTEEGAASESTGGKQSGGELAGARRIVSNGPFRLGESGADGVVLERESNYWNASQVALERVRFVGASDAEAALAAYRAGEVDAVTNAKIEPLGLKLLASYKDFRRTTFGAVTYYDVNATRPPFDDPRVRRALALAIDRERLSADTLGGAAEPAEKFLPVEKGIDESENGNGPTHGKPAGGSSAAAGGESAGGSGGETAGGEAAPASEYGRDGRRVAGAGGAAGGESGEATGGESGSSSGGDSRGESEDESGGGAAPLRFDPDGARRLLAEAGFPGGEGFPRVRLLVNRNEQHRVVAEAVAGMWRAVLGVETEILLRGWDEYEMLLRTGEFDVARRSLILQTPDEAANVLSMFSPERFDFDAATEVAEALAPEQPGASPSPAQGATRAPDAPPPAPLPRALYTEAEALREVPAIPVYFATSAALVKPYVRGFDSNLLDAPSLQRVRIDTAWQPPRRETPGGFAGFGGR